MAMFSTPKQAPLMIQPFTPPFSPSKPLFYSPIMRMQFSPALPLPFPSPAATPPPEQKDIPTELYLGGYAMVAEKVFSYLSGADLSNCLQVCTTWTQQISSNSHFMTQVTTHRRQCKENAENLYKSQMEQPLVAPLQRIPLASLLPNKKAPVCCVSAPHSTCPVQKVNLHWPDHSEFSPGGDCTVSRSLKRPRESEAICGTKKSKKRLRRLWGSSSKCQGQNPLTPVSTIRIRGPEQEAFSHPRRHDGESSQPNFQCTSHMKCMVVTYNIYTLSLQVILLVFKSLWANQMFVPPH